MRLPIFIFRKKKKIFLKLLISRTRERESIKVVSQVLATTKLYLWTLYYSLAFFFLIVFLCNYELLGFGGRTILK